MIGSVAAALFLLLPCAANAQDDSKTGHGKTQRGLPTGKAAAKGAPAPKGQAAPVVGTTSSAPERKLGAAKEPCVYKPVMTNEDMERCR
jgi:hypothetical protein